MRILNMLPTYKEKSLFDILKFAKFQTSLLNRQEVLSSQTVNLKKTMSVPSESKLIELVSFLDKDCSMRAKEQLRKADVEYQIKHPIIFHFHYWAVKFFWMKCTKKAA